MENMYFNCRIKSKRNNNNIDFQHIGRELSQRARARELELGSQVAREPELESWSQKAINRELESQKQRGKDRAIARDLEL